MQAITTIGLDIAKSVFQIHGIDAAGNVTVRRKLKRPYVLLFFQKLPPCVVGIEACASSHHWSRELQALGHTVRLMPPAYVKPYIKRQKNDAADAEAICEASPGPTCGSWRASAARRLLPENGANLFAATPSPLGGGAGISLALSHQRMAVKRWASRCRSRPQAGGAGRA